MTTPSPEFRIDVGDPYEPDVAALLAASEAYSHSLYRPENVHTLDVDKLTAAGVRFLVARSGAGLAQGCGALVIEGEGSAELKRMYVTPAARGKGLGTSILRRLEQDAVRAGVRVMRLETGVLQREALRLYHRLGYRQRGPFGAYLPDSLSVFMEKELAP